MYPKHDEDFYGWVIASTKLMKEGKLSELDIDSLIEEMELMGGSVRQEFLNRLSVLIAHLLKWRYQPSRRPDDISGRSWRGTIREQRSSLKDLLVDNPSLKSKDEETLARAYNRAFSIIEKETPIDLKVLPKECPYTLKQCLDESFYPE